MNIEELHSLVSDIVGNNENYVSQRVNLRGEVIIRDRHLDWREFVEWFTGAYKYYLDDVNCEDVNLVLSQVLSVGRNLLEDVLMPIHKWLTINK